MFMVVVIWVLLEWFGDCLYSFAYRLDEIVAGTVEEGEFAEHQEQDPENFAEQGKLLSELAHLYICIYFKQMFYS